MKIICEKHGEVEVTQNKNGNTWCPECRQEAFIEFLASDNGKAKLSHVVHDHIRAQPPRSFVTVDGERMWEPLVVLPKSVTCHKPGTPDFVPPLPRPFGETMGIEPVYRETYLRRVRVDEDDE